MSVPTLPSVFICLKNLMETKLRNWYYQIKVSPVLSCTRLLLCDTSQVEWGGKKVATYTLTDVFIHLFFYILYNVEKHTQNRH